MTTQSEITQQNHRRAIRFFWTLLMLATTSSLAGNIWHAMLVSPPGERLQAVAGASVAPIFLLMCVHGIAVLARTTASGTAYRAVVAVVALIGAGAFVQSFVALRGFAEGAGIPAALTWVTPVVIDATIGAATLALVVIGDKPAQRVRTALPQVGQGSKPAPRPESVHARRRSALADSHAVAARGTSAHPALQASSVPPADAGGDHTALAQAVVDAGATTKPVALVASILSAHAQGTALNRIAADLAVHHKTVARIINAAEQSQLLAAS